jgi:hypothetical protein
MAVAVVFESRLAGSDGAYTDQKVVLVDADEDLDWFFLEHDLGRIPDWVRVTKLTYGLVIEAEAEWDGPASAAAAHLEPTLDVVASVAAGRLVWDTGIDDGGASGRPASVEDLATGIWFGAAGDVTTVEPLHTGQDAYYLVEFGITHSVSK